MRTLVAAAEPPEQPNVYTVVNLAGLGGWLLTPPPNVGMASGGGFTFNVTTGADAEPATGPGPYRTTAYVGRPVPEITAE